MCSVKTPKPPPPSANSQKPPVYMRNSYLDGLGISGENAGRNSLRIDLGTPRARPPAPRPPVVIPTLPPGGIGGTRPPGGGGGGGRTGGGFGGGDFGLGIRLR